VEPRRVPAATLPENYGTIATDFTELDTWPGAGVFFLGVVKDQILARGLRRRKGAGPFRTRGTCSWAEVLRKPVHRLESTGYEQLGLCPRGGEAEGPCAAARHRLRAGPPTGSRSSCPAGSGLMWVEGPLQLHGEDRGRSADSWTGKLGRGHGPTAPGQVEDATVGVGLGHARSQRTRGALSGKRNPRVDRRGAARRLAPPSRWTPCLRFGTSNVNATAFPRMDE